MAKAMYSIVFNRKGHISKDGTAPVSVCAYLDGQRKYVTTDIKIKPEQWDKTRHQLKPSAPNFIQKNSYLRGIIEKLEKYEFEKIENGETVYLDELLECLENQRDKTDFLLFFREEVKKNKKITLNTQKVYNTTYKHLSEFRKNIRFDDLTFQFVNDFENFLIDKGININSAGKYLKALKAVINLAINYGIFDVNKYPFRGYKIKTQPANRMYLIPEEIERIENMIPTSPNMEQVRDMYLFAIYTGLRFSDIVSITPKNIQETEGKKYLVLNMEKTKEYLRLPLYQLFAGKPIKILEKYYNPEKRYYFDTFTNQFVNRELKEIAKIAGITKRVTFHTARHTSATYLIYKGVPLPVVQRFLGHTKISTTEIYAKVMDMTTENELKKIF